MANEAALTLANEDGEALWEGDELPSAELPRMIERCMRMLHEQAEIAESLKELMAEARAKDLDPVAIKKAAQLRVNQAKKVKFEEGMKTLFDYMEAAGDPLEVR